MCFVTKRTAARLWRCYNNVRTKLDRCSVTTDPELYLNLRERFVVLSYVYTASAQKGFSHGCMASRVIEFLRADEYLWKTNFLRDLPEITGMERNHLNFMMRLWRLLNANVARINEIGLYINACAFELKFLGLCLFNCVIFCLIPHLEIN